MGNTTNVTMEQAEIYPTNKEQALVIFSKLDIGLASELPTTWNQL